MIHVETKKRKHCSDMMQQKKCFSRPSDCSLLCTAGLYLNVLMRGRAGGLMNRLVPGVCQQICGDVLRVAHFLPSLSAPCLLLSRVMARGREREEGNYGQFKPGHSTPCLRATRSAASAANTQLNFHCRVAKQQSTTHTHTHKMSETTFMCCINPGFLRDLQCVVHRLSSP